MTEEKLREYVWKDDGKIYAQVEKDAAEHAKEEVSRLNMTSGFWGLEQKNAVERMLESAYRKAQFDAMMKYKK